MSILLNPIFRNTFDSATNINKIIPDHQRKVTSIAVAIFLVSIPVLYFVYRRYTQTPCDKNTLPKPITNVFEKYRYNPDQLPRLDTEHVLFALDGECYVKRIDMISPVMLFQDSHGCHGIALLICGKTTSTRQISATHEIAPNMPASKICAVWAFHQDHINKGSWVGAELFTFVEDIINNRHTERASVKTRDASPVDDYGLLSPVLFEDLFLGRDPDFQLGEDPNFRLFDAVGVLDQLD